MATVFEARHEEVGRRFALKFLRPNAIGVNGALERFQLEARAAGGLESEHVAATLDYGYTEQGVPFLVMELLVGETLASVLEREGPLPAGLRSILHHQARRGGHRSRALRLAQHHGVHGRRDPAREP